MSIATVVTRGYGSFGTIPLVVTAGYSIGEAIVIDEAAPEQTFGIFTFIMTAGNFLQAQTLGRFTDIDTTGKFKP